MELKLNVRDDDLPVFKRCVRKLLESTFILKDKDPKLYSYISKESNRQDVSEYLRMCGFDVITDDRTKAAMLTVSEEDSETPGFKRANVITFNTTQYHMLIVLWETYLENLGRDEDVFIERGDLIDKIKAYMPAVVSSELKGAFRLFKKYSLIDYNENEQDETALIKLYPSLQFTWDVDQFRTVAGKYMRESSDTDDTQEDEQAEDDIYTDNIRDEEDE